MSTPSEKLADAVEKLHAVQVDGIVRSESLTRTYSTRLIKAGFLHQIIRGWYYVANPIASPGETAWYGHYWNFLAQYLTDRFGADYCLLSESSLMLLTGSTIVPRQLSIMRRSAGQQVLPLCLGTSLFIYQDRGNFPERTVERDGLRTMDLTEALVRIPDAFYRSSADTATVALLMLRDPTDLLSDVLKNGRTAAAGRLAGAFRHVNDDTTADRILRVMRTAGFDVRESDPFERPLQSPVELVRQPSPYVIRLRLMWAEMRDDVAAVFVSMPPVAQSTDLILTNIDEKYLQDAYHSLSIEGYRVTPQLIEKVRDGRWRPDRNSSDKDAENALAARGYFEAFQVVKATIKDILQGKNAGEATRHAHHTWHEAMFAASVQAGLLTSETLAGYRRSPVFIRGSRHVPLPDHALTDAMETLFELLAQEDVPAIRAILGHFLFVFIHPYVDGNGRMARFLMNTMFTTGGYLWTVIRLEHRTQYMEALEQASADRNIRPFAEFIKREMSA